MLRDSGNVFTWDEGAAVMYVLKPSLSGNTERLTREAHNAAACFQTSRSGGEGTGGGTGEAGRTPCPLPAKPPRWECLPSVPRSPCPGRTEQTGLLSCVRASGVPRWHPGSAAGPLGDPGEVAWPLCASGSSPVSITGPQPPPRQSSVEKVKCVMLQARRKYFINWLLVYYHCHCSRRHSLYYYYYIELRALS